MNEELLKRLEAIALEHTGVPQLTARNRDALDFHDVGCVSLQRALHAAYMMGRREGMEEASGMGLPGPR